MAKFLSKELTAETETVTKSHLGLFIRNHVRPESTYSEIKLWVNICKKPGSDKEKEICHQKGMEKTSLN